MDENSLMFGACVNIKPEEVSRYFLDPELLATWICGGGWRVRCDYNPRANVMQIGFIKILDGEERYLEWRNLDVTSDLISMKQIWMEAYETDIKVEFGPAERGTRLWVTIEGRIDDFLEEEYSRDWAALENIGKPPWSLSRLLMKIPGLKPREMSRAISQFGTRVYIQPEKVGDYFSDPILLAHWIYGGGSRVKCEYNARTSTMHVTDGYTRYLKLEELEITSEQISMKQTCLDSYEADVTVEIVREGTGTNLRVSIEGRMNEEIAKEYLGIWSALEKIGRHPASFAPSPEEYPVLKYCAEILEKRIEDDPENAWLWKSNLKVARYSLSLYEDPLTDEISPAEEKQIQKEHSLLQLRPPVARAVKRKSPARWEEEIQAKISRFMGRKE